MIGKVACAACLVALALAGRAASDDLAAGFANPPDSARPQVWWHWMNGNVSKDGITADLEAFREKGIGGVHLFDVDYGIPKGPVTFNTSAWFDHVAWAAQEARRLGLEITVCTGSGWCTGGGPWDRLEDGMRFTCWRETVLSGPTNGTIRLERPAEARAYRDIAVVAYPKPVPDSAPAITNFPLKTLRFAFEIKGKVPDSVGGLVAPGAAVDLTDRMKPDGMLDWQVPAGEWCVLRLGSYVFGARSYPSSSAGSGWEYDKLSKRAYDLHFDGYLKKLLDHLGPLAGKGSSGVTGLLLDSYEPGSQNWTDDLPAEFERIMGYSMKPYYPVLAGRVVSSLEVSERFLRDFRRVIADLFARNFADRQVERAHAYGLKVYHEPYGSPTPGDFLQYGQNADVPMSEYWAWDQDKTRLDGGSPIAGHIAHFWGRRVVAAESFTTWPTLAGWRQDPYSLKGWNDAGYVQGVNQVVYHGAVHQPWLDEHLSPGMTLGRFGVHFGRTVTWWPLAGEWIRYQTRCQHLLQEGTFRADVLAFAGDDAPKDTIKSIEKMKGRPGYGFDAITREGLKAVRVRDGCLVSPGGVTYRVLYVGAHESMEPESLEAIARLVAAGATVVGRRPTKACGLRDYPYADAVVAKRAAEVWADKRVIDSDSLDVGLKAIGLCPDWAFAGGDIRAIHRGYADGTEGYFVMNAAHREAVTAQGVFRVTGLVPEFWDAETGRITRVADWSDDGTTTKLDIPLGPQGSVFVMFRPKDRATVGAEPQTVRETLSETDLSSGWTVSFPAGWGAPASITLGTLASWTAQADEGVRHFSGIATYEKTARIANYDPPRRYSLDLGDVRNLAQVTVNGKRYPALWKPPFVLDITDAVKGPELKLSIRVANLWINRLIGDEEKPEDVTWTEKRWKGPHLAEWPDWFVRKEPRVSGRLTFATWHHWKKGDALVDSGLLGPVRVREETLQAPARHARSHHSLTLTPGGSKAIFEEGEIPELKLVAKSASLRESVMKISLETRNYFNKVVLRRESELRIPANGELKKTLYFKTLPGNGFFCTRICWQVGNESGAVEGSFVKVARPPKKADPLFGMSGFSPNDRPMLDVYRLMGVGTKGVDFEWRQFEMKDGKYDFSRRKAEIREMIAGGLALRGMMTFVGGNQAPDRYIKPEFLPRVRRMDKKGDPIVDQERYYTDMADFIRQVVTEFKGEIREWSIVGEIDILIRWAPHIRQRYLDTMRIAAKAIREADPTAIVYGFGTSGGDGQAIPRYRTTRQLIPEVEGLLDGFGIDQYTAGTHYGKGFVTKNTEESELREMMLEARRLADEHGVKYISVDEKGPAFDTSLPISTPLGSEAGDMVARDYIILKSLPFVRTWLYFRPTNWTVTHGGLDWGMWQDQNPRQTVSAYAATARQMAGAEFVKEILVHKDVRCYAFRKDGNDFVAMWYNGQEPLAVCDSAVDSLRVVDIEGNSVELKNSTLTISRSPIYVSGLSVERLERLFASAELNVPYIAAAFAVQAVGKSTLAVRNLTGKELTAKVVEFASEPAFVWTKGEITLGPNETKRIELSCSPNKTKITLRGSVGGSVTLTDEYRPIALGRVAGWEDVARQEPIRLDDPERQSPNYVDLRANGVYTGIDDLSAEARFGYDNENFYADVRVTDDIHLNDVQGSWLLWMADSVQFFFDARRDGAFDRLEGKKGEMPDDSLIAMGDLKGWKCGYLHYGADLKGQRIRAQQLPVKPEIVRDEKRKITHYRLKLPFACVSPLKPVKGRAFGFSFIVFDKDQSMQHVAYGISPNGASVGWNDPRFMPVFVFQ